MTLRRLPADWEPPTSEEFWRAAKKPYHGILYSDKELAEFEEAERLEKEKQREEDLKQPDGELLVATSEWLEKASKEGKGRNLDELDAWLESKGLK